MSQAGCSFSFCALRSLRALTPLSVAFYFVVSFTLASTAACSPREEAATAQAGGLQQISAPEAYRRVQAGEMKLIDIRTPDEWRQTGVAKGAARINMLHPAGMRGFAEAVLQAADGNIDAPVGIICRTGNRTTHMQQQLRAAGFTQIYNIKEGMVGSAAGPGWIRQGLPVEACVRC